MKKVVIALAVLGLISCEEVATSEQCPTTMKLVEWEECILEKDGYTNDTFIAAPPKVGEDIKFLCGQNLTKGRMFEANKDGIRVRGGFCNPQNKDYKIVITDTL